MAIWRQAVRSSGLLICRQAAQVCRPTSLLPKRLAWTAPQAVEASCSYATTRSANNRSDDTIFALASGGGRAGVAVIRVSGPNVSELYFSMCLTSARAPYRRLPPSHKLVVRNLHHPISGDLLDSGAGVIYFPQGRSYTGEESIEFHVHGGLATVTDMLDALGVGLKSRVRPAEPGEFTRRAFENGRIDLTSSEALHSLIVAETSVQRKVALSGARGLQTARYEAMRATLLDAMALVEALIDFGDEDGVETGTWTAAKIKVSDIVTLIQSEVGSPTSDGVLAKRHVGEIVTQGIRLALYGPPNAGKSSLLNHLADRTAAIVSPIPGTTRDVLNVSLDLGGYKVIVYDTAGLRSIGDNHPQDAIEQVGMERARTAVLEADLALLVQPATGDTHDRLRPESYTANDPDLVFYNKTDLLDGHPRKAAAIGEQQEAWYGSVKTGEGITDLVQGLQTVIRARYAAALTQEAPLITQTRHRYHLQDCLSHLLQFQRLASDDAPDLVLAAEELRHSAQTLGRVTGSQIRPDEILGTIFSTFCIGK